MMPFNEYVLEANMKLSGYGAHYEVRAELKAKTVTSLSLYSTLYDAPVALCGSFTEIGARCFITGLLAAESARAYEVELNV